jgi:hypothetical protein
MFLDNEKYSNFIPLKKESLNKKDISIFHVQSRIIYLVAYGVFS